MKCQYCGAEIKDGALFCDNCGQAVGNASNADNYTDAFWQKENAQKKKEAIEQLNNLKGKSDEVQAAIAAGKKLESKKFFFKTMLVVLLALVAALAFSIFQAVTSSSDLYTELSVTLGITLVALLRYIAYATMIIKKGVGGIFFPLIPVFGYFYLLYSIAGGIKRLFAPLEKSEVATFKDLKEKKIDFQLLKQEEKDLKTGLSLIDKNVFEDPSLKHLKKTIVTENKKKANGWQVTTVISIIVLVLVFVVSFFVAPIIADGVAELTINTVNGLLK